MNYFLSNFNKDNYEDTKEKKEANVHPQTHKTTIETNGNDKQKATRQSNDPFEQEKEKEPRKTRVQQSNQEVEIDPNYQKNKRRKQQFIGVGAIVAGLLFFFVYYQATHLKLPDFVGKDIAEVRSWAVENKMKLDVKQEYNLDTESNQVIAQNKKKNSSIKKGDTMVVTVSLGADPETQLQLPDFMTMTRSEVENWIKENKATNISVIDEYSDTIEKGTATRFEIANKDVTKENYKRKDKANMYYSKGKETFEKTIVVPDFRNKSKSEVESWAKTNAISMTYEQASSSDIQLDSIISQSVEKDQKIAKKDSMTVTVSLGKGYTVPNFSDYTLEEAASAAEGLQIQAKSVFTDKVPYGQLISQSVAAGTQLTSKDDLKVSVLYSAGKPYLKDLRGNMVEGELQKWFYDEFQSKGADVKYVTRYVDSAETKGTVVGMSAYNLYIPFNYTVTIDISLGNLAAASTYASNKQSNSSDDNAEATDDSKKQTNTLGD